MQNSANYNTAEHNRHCSNNKSTNSLPIAGNKTVLLETIASFSQALSSHPCGMSKPPLEAPVTVSIVGRTRRIKCDKLFSSDRNPGTGPSGQRKTLECQTRSYCRGCHHCNWDTSLKTDPPSPLCVIHTIGLYYCSKVDISICLQYVYN